MQDELKKTTAELKEILARLRELNGEFSAEAEGLREYASGLENIPSTSGLARALLKEQTLVTAYSRNVEKYLQRKENSLELYAEAEATAARLVLNLTQADASEPEQ